MPQLLTRPAFWLAAYLVLMNLVTFWVYGADKRRPAGQMARAGKDAVSAAPAGRQHRGPGRYAGVSPQNPALVLPLGYSRHFPSPTGCLRRRMVPEQVICPPFSPAGRCVLPFAAPRKARKPPAAAGGFLAIWFPNFFFTSRRWSRSPPARPGAERPLPRRCGRDTGPR